MTAVTPEILGQEKYSLPIFLFFCHLPHISNGLSCQEPLVDHISTCVSDDIDTFSLIVDNTFYYSAKVLETDDCKFLQQSNTGSSYPYLQKKAAVFCGKKTAAFQSKILLND
ncbi:hypothetical protein APU01nite_02970 [Alkalibacterium putridalgicola]|uniref:Uncharacterized protein n=1 Tax=Alkalibacterium putridalgicola TaxID=426703 RepID=A0ABQ0UUP3_9LACT|nr:hypothetical protein APU01nite_02970 [Alkalibacterium putridalgicola]